jgi:quinol monooxygenase YgiN
MELFIIARFHARAGQDAAVGAAVADVLGPTRQDAGCRMIQAYRSIRDPRLHFIHSRWEDEAAFELHATLPHTVAFLECVESLIDHPLDVERVRPSGG